MTPYDCFYKLGVLLAGVLKIRACYLGSVLRPLIFGNSQCRIYKGPTKSWVLVGQGFKAEVPRFCITEHKPEQEKKYFEGTPV